MSVFVNVSLAVCNGAYVSYLAVLYSECELGNCCVAIRSSCLFKTVLAILKAFKLCIVACELSLCNFAQSCTAVNLYA